MAVSGKERAARERTRVYRARQELHRAQVRRRTRDDVVAGVAGGILILAVLAGQLAYYTAGPGMPAPAPASTTSPTPGDPFTDLPLPQSTTGG